MSTNYTPGFFETLTAPAEDSAKEILPLAFKPFRISSIVDVGCGEGTWLRTCLDMGIVDILGLDGDYVPRSQLKIPLEKFIPTDLSNPQPVGRMFDLAMSLEVAEHLPPASAERFVKFLTSLSPRVLFSAAIPAQGGTDHLNEQWPAYWISHFEKAGYAVVDRLRSMVWHNPKVARWYAQNTLFFIRADLKEDIAISELAWGADFRGESFVHPAVLHYSRRDVERLEKQYDPARMPFFKSLGMTRASLKHALRRRLKLGS